MSVHPPTHLSIHRCLLPLRTRLSSTGSIQYHTIHTYTNSVRCAGTSSVPLWFIQLGSRVYIGTVLARSTPCLASRLLRRSSCSLMSSLRFPNRDLMCKGLLSSLYSVPYPTAPFYFSRHARISISACPSQAATSAQPATWTWPASSPSSRWRCRRNPCFGRLVAMLRHHVLDRTAHTHTHTHTHQGGAGGGEGRVQSDLAIRESPVVSSRSSNTYSGGYSCMPATSSPHPAVRFKPSPPRLALSLLPWPWNP
ncbi:hypothetical protein GGS23DRAFT_461936 [Durotheca rogersii]|uniref:uncharacterized protein n=1 Tax=Durotheca rogersii TaxID=419775 RepID=UPI00221F629A|nr:uncharacterized protein GGS23DRAFT_461936 [Durotheca rogersii]KAI5864751.1 hypothetical protein GGS23DRAFT_461936 [Durotheca rogersii]